MIKPFQIKMKRNTLFSYKIIIMLMLLCSQCFATDKLIFALDLIRHGDRTPIHDMAQSSHHWQEGTGQLTKKGMEKAYEFGVTLRNRYVLDNHLLPPQYSPQTLYVRSTDFDRTIMTAQSVLLGLYPLGTGPLPGGFQPIPIHTQSQSRDELIPYPMMDDHWRKHFFKKQLSQNNEWVTQSQALTAKLAHWGQIMGKPIHDLSQVANLSDTMAIYQAHDIPLPYDMSQPEIDEFIGTGQWAFSQLFMPQTVGSTLAHEMLLTIAKYIKQASQAESPLKYVLFSGHDVSIMSLLSALDVPLTEPPAYLSHVNIAIYAKDSGEQYLIIRFNERPLHMPYCQSTKCTVNQFLTLVDQTRLKRDKDALNAFSKECATLASPLA